VEEQDVIVEEVVKLVR